MYKYEMRIALCLLAVCALTAADPCSSGRLLPHEDCSQFYQCVGGEKVAMPCAAGLWFDRDLQVCNWPQLVTCELQTENTETTEAQFTTEAVKTSTASDVQTTESKEKFVCPESPHVHQLLPHESDCSRFYQCVHGAKVAMSCAPGTWFDYDLQVCNWPQLVTCELQIENTETTEAQVTTEAVKTSTASDVQTTESKDQYVCPESAHVHQLLPHESDCSRFYQCVHGAKVAMNCAPGTWFDYDLQVCNWPELVACRVTPTTEADKVTTESAPVEKDSTEEVYSSSAESETPKSSETNSSEEDSTSSDANTSEEEASVTDSDESASENSSEPTTTQEPSTPTTTQATELADSSEETTTTANGETSEDERSTEEQSTEEVNVPGGQNPEPEVEGSAEAATPEPVETEEDNDSEEAPICAAGVVGNVPHPTLCDSYYLCSGGFPILLRCSSGFEFDPVLERCVVITGKGCTPLEEESSQEQSSDESSESTEEESESDEEVNTPGGQNPEPELEVSAEATVAICPPGYSGNVPDLESCFSYYLCSSGFPIKLHCSTGFEYNPISMRCEAISSTGCSAGLETESATESNQSLCPVNLVGNVANPDNCSAYFYCAMSVQVPLLCSSGFEFDPALARCVQISDSGCTANKN